VRSNNSSSIALSSHFRSSSILSPCKSPFKFAFASCCSCMLSGDVDAHNTSGGLTSERMPCFAGHQRQRWPNNNGARAALQQPLPPPYSSGERSLTAGSLSLSLSLSLYIIGSFSRPYSTVWETRLSDHLEMQLWPACACSKQKGVHACTIDLVRITRIGGCANC